MQKLVWQNSNGDVIDLTSGNYNITNWEGFSNADLNIQSQQVPFQDGGVFLDALIEQRELSVTLAMNDNGNLEERYRMRRELIHALNPKLGEGYLIYTNDFISKRIKCVSQIPLFPTHNSNDSGTPKASLAWTACEPYWEDLEETVVTIDSNEVATLENLGDIPAQVKMDFEAGAENPIVYNRRDGKQIKLNGTLENAVEVDTNLGNKKVTSFDTGFTWEAGGTFTDFAEGVGIIIFVGSQIVLRNILTGETKTLYLGGALANNNINIKGIAYGNGKFVICGSWLGGVVISSDGQNWTKIDFPNVTTTNFISYVNGIFVTQYTFGTIFTSTDGETWNTVELTYDGNCSFTKIIYGQGKYIAIGTHRDTGTTHNSYGIFYSLDLVNWTRVLSSENYHILDVIYVESLNTFYAVNRRNLYTSSDGQNWTTHSNIFPSGQTLNQSVNSIAYANEKFVAVANNLVIYTSDDGENWVINEEFYDSSDPDKDLVNVKYVAGKFITVGGAKVFSSIDGENWDKDSDFFNNSLNYLFHKDDLYILGGDLLFKYSNDNRKTWNDVNFTETSIYSKSVKKIVFANGKFVAVGSSHIYSSNDGINWLPIYFQRKEFNSVAYGDGLFVAVGNAINPAVGAGATCIYTSTDGENWTEQTIAETQINWIFWSIIYAQGQFIACTDMGRFFTSTDGESWTRHDIILNPSQPQEIWTTALRCIDYDSVSNMYLLGTVYYTQSQVVILYSYDLNNWKKIVLETGYSDYVDCISHNDNMYIAVGRKFIYTSTDGKNWVHRNVDILAWFHGVLMNNEELLIVGSGGIVAKEKIFDRTNVISLLDESSNMDFNLNEGENDLYYYDEAGKKLKISYRQKYIGV